MHMTEPQILAHRGFSGPYPENSPLAFRAAAEETGADGIETDVQMTKDGRLVLMHDERVDRTSNGHGYVRDLTWEQMQELDIGGWKGFPGETVWSLEQLLDFCREKHLLLNIELKNGIVFYTGLEERVAELIRQRHMQEQVVLSSFNHASMARFKSLCPEVETGLLYSEPLAQTVRYVELAGADGIHPCHRVLTYQPELVAQCHARGKKVRVWTVDGEAELRRMLEAGVDCIITDWPDRAEKIRAGA